MNEIYLSKASMILGSTTACGLNSKASKGIQCHILRRQIQWCCQWQCPQSWPGEICEPRPGCNSASCCPGTRIRRRRCSSGRNRTTRSRHSNPERGAHIIPGELKKISHPRAEHGAVTHKEALQAARKGSEAVFESEVKWWGARRDRSCWGPRKQLP